MPIQSRTAGIFAEGDAGLRHAPRPRVHAEEEHLFLAAGEAAEVLAMGIPRVFHWVVCVGHRL